MNHMQLSAAHLIRKARRKIFYPEGSTGIYIFIAALLWSCAGLIIKTVECGAIWIVFIRCFSAGLVTLPFLLKKKIEPLASAVKSGIYFGLFIFAVTAITKVGSAALAMAAQYAAPVYVLAFLFFKYGFKPINKVVSFVFLLAGLVLCLINPLSSGNSVELALFPLAGVFFILYTREIQKIKTGSALGITCVVNLVCAGMFLVLLPLDLKNHPTSFRDVMLLIILGIVVSVVSYTIYGIGLKRVTLEGAMVITLTEPVLNPVWVYLATDEIPDNYTIIGLVVILFGAVMDIAIKKLKKIKDKLRKN